VYVRFGGEYPETCRSNPVRRWVLSLQIAHQANATGMVDVSGYWRNVTKLDEAIAGIMTAIELPKPVQ